MDFQFQFKIFMDFGEFYMNFSLSVLLFILNIDTHTVVLKVLKNRFCWVYHIYIFGSFREILINLNTVELKNINLKEG
jgi:hypothetical protein